VPIGFEVAKKLDAPLDLVLVRKIGVPSQPELAYGAIVDGEEPELVVNEEVEAFLHVPKKFLDEQSARELKEIARRRELYLAGRPRPEIRHRTILVVDDGIATGMTVRASLKALRRGRPKKLVLAVPVAPAATIKKLGEDADEIVCLAAPEDFYAISQFYTDFHQVSDEEVIALLNQAPSDVKADQSPLAS
jgi:putative phosphoribosyl transferase